MNEYYLYRIHGQELALAARMGRLENSRFGEKKRINAGIRTQGSLHSLTPPRAELNLA